MCDKLILTKKDGGRIMIERHSVYMVEEVVKDDSAIVSHNMLGEVHTIAVLDTFDSVMAMMYPEKEVEDEHPMPGGMPY